MNKKRKRQMNCLLLFSHSVVSDSLWPQGLQHTRLPCPSLSPRACSNSCPSSGWCQPTISSPVFPFSCPQSFPRSSTAGPEPLRAWLRAWGSGVGILHARFRTHGARVQLQQPGIQPEGMDGVTEKPRQPLSFLDCLFISSLWFSFILLQKH